MPAQSRGRVQESAGVVVRRVGEDVQDATGLHDPAVVHDGDPVGGLGHHAEVVGDEDDGHAVPLPELDEEVEDLPLHGDVQRGGRLVGDEHPRPAHQRGRDHHALAQPAGELVRVLPVAAFRVGDADLVQCRDGGLPGAGPGQPLVVPEHFGDLAADALERVEAGHRVLEDHGDVMSPDPPEFLLGEREQVLAVEEDLAAAVDAERSRVEAQHGEGGGRLPTAGLPDHGERLARGDLQGDAPYGVHGGAFEPEVDAEVADAEQRLRLTGFHRRYAFGSATSRRASPVMLTASEVTIRAAPGKTASHQEVPR